MLKVCLGVRNAHLAGESDLSFYIELDLHQLLSIELLDIEGVLHHRLIGVDHFHQSSQVFFIQSSNVFDELLLFSQAYHSMLFYILLLIRNFPPDLSGASMGFRNSAFSCGTLVLTLVSGLSGGVAVGHRFEVVGLEFGSDLHEFFVVFVEDVTVSDDFIDVGVELGSSFVFIIF